MPAWFVLALGVLPRPVERVPTLTLVWHDSGHLFAAAGLAKLAEETESLFRAHGLSVRFHAAAENENLKRIPEPRINAVLLPDDQRFGLPPNTMAAALGERGGKYGIFVFYASVRRTLGYRPSESSPRHILELARALSRIVAHEVVHTLAPERGHAESGLMTKKLTRDLLLADRIELDGRSLDLAVAAMRAWWTPARTSELPAFRSIFGPEVSVTWQSVR